MENSLSLKQCDEKDKEKIKSINGTTLLS